MHNNRSVQCEKGITGNSPRGLEGIVINAAQAITPTGLSHQSLFGGKTLRWRRRAHTNRYAVTVEEGRVSRARAPNKCKLAGAHFAPMLN